MWLAQHRSQISKNKDDKKKSEKENKVKISTKRGYKEGNYDQNDDYIKNPKKQIKHLQEEDFNYSDSKNKKNIFKIINNNKTTNNTDKSNKRSFVEMSSLNQQIEWFKWENNSCYIDSFLTIAYFNLYRNREFFVNQDPLIDILEKLLVFNTMLDTRDFNTNINIMRGYLREYLDEIKFNNEMI